MPVFYNLPGIIMVCLSFFCWLILALYIPEIGGDIILYSSIGLLFLLDVLYRYMIARPAIHGLKEENLNEGKRFFRKDLNFVFPSYLAVTITNLGGSFMLIPCWLFASLSIVFVYYAIS